MWQILVSVLEWCGWMALGLFSLHQLWLLALCVWHRRRAPRPLGPVDPLPVVTVQLPVFNERYVVERLLDAVARLDYPRELLEIQVLDDSTDETTSLIAQRLQPLQAQGYRIVHLHRTHRGGFKAGALAEGLAVTRGEFIALFDADFVPPPDFLRQTLDYFTDPRIGMVQARWGHLNRSDSLLTRAQALMLDGHFLIEQVARSRGGCFFNFNGSAGVWRRQAIVEAGGWQPDTLSEDLDLSYRAQLRGWRFVYLRDVVVPAELPREIGSLKTQHHRWTKGSIQVAAKLLPAVLRSRQPLRVKLAACFHFGAWFHYPLGLLVMLLLLPRLAIGASPIALHPAISLGGLVGGLLLMSTALFCVTVQRQSGMPWRRFLLDVPALMAMTAGLAVNNTRAIWEAVRGTPSGFDRTPKHNGRRVPRRPPDYTPQPYGTRWWYGELGVGMYAVVILGYAVSRAFYAAVLFLLPISAGLLYAGVSSFLSVWDRWTWKALEVEGVTQVVE